VPGDLALVGAALRRRQGRIHPEGAALMDSAQSERDLAAEHEARVSVIRRDPEAAAKYIAGVESEAEKRREALVMAQVALHKLCLARGSTDGYSHVFDAINEAL
jgi:hypothetical protein